MTGSEKSLLVPPVASRIDISNFCGREVGGRREGKEGGKEEGTKVIVSLGLPSLELVSAPWP